MMMKRNIDDIAEGLGKRFSSGAELYMEWVNTLSEEDYQKHLAGREVEDAQKQCDD
jgi:hypothetical protein